jgi:hypothetical protein
MILANRLISLGKSDIEPIHMEVIATILLERKDADFAKPYCIRILNELSLMKEQTLV